MRPEAMAVEREVEAMALAGEVEMAAERVEMAAVERGGIEVATEPSCTAWG